MRKQKIVENSLIQSSLMFRTLLEIPLKLRNLSVSQYGYVLMKFSMEIIIYLMVSIQMISNKVHLEFVICQQLYRPQLSRLKESEIFLFFMTKQQDSMFLKFLFMDKSNMLLSMMQSHVANQLSLHYLPSRMVMSYGFVFQKKHGPNVQEII